MRRIENLSRALAGALISVTVVLVALAQPLAALAGSGSPGGM